MENEQLFTAAKNIRLSPREMAAMDEQVMRFVRNHPVNATPFDVASIAESHGFLETMRSLFFSLRAIPAFAIAAVIVLSTSLSVAASSALPGDFLYPIKVHVNEPVQAALQGSADARARFQAERLEIRLEEAAQLAAAGRLQGETKDEVSSGINGQLDVIQNAASALAAGGDADAALDVHSQVESNLIANAAVLSALLETKGPAESDVRDLLHEVSQAEHVAAKTRTKSEATVSADTSDSEVAANTNIGTATQRIDSVRVFMDSNTSSVNGQVRLQAGARLDYSKKILGNARTQLNAKKFVDASQLAREAQRTAQEAITMLKASANLQQHLSVTESSSSLAPRSSSASSGSSEVGSSSARHEDDGKTSDHKETTTEGSADQHMGDVDLKGVGEGKINLGL